MRYAELRCTERDTKHFRNARTKFQTSLVHLQPTTCPTTHRLLFNTAAPTVTADVTTDAVPKLDPNLLTELLPEILPQILPESPNVNKGCSPRRSRTSSGVGHDDDKRITGIGNVLRGENDSFAVPPSSLLPFRPAGERASGSMTRGNTLRVRLQLVPKRRGGDDGKTERLQERRQLVVVRCR